LIQVAREAVRQLGDLLGAQVAVVGAEDVLVAGEAVTGEVALRVALSVDGQLAEVVVAASNAAEAVPPRAARALVELVVGRLVGSERPPSQYDLKNAFIHDLLHGQLASESAALREGQLLGMDLTQPRAVIVIDARAYILACDEPGSGQPADERVRQRARAVIGSVVSFFHLPDETICAYIGDGEIAILKASNTRNLALWADRHDPGASCDSWANLAALRRAGEALLRRLHNDTDVTISIGIGRYHPGLSGLSRSYGDARAALALGCRFHGQNKVHCLDRLGIAAFVGAFDECTKADLAAYLLSPLDDEPELIATLGAFFTVDCCPSQAAERLAIHRNTLSYRLEKVASLTGLNPRRFDDAVQIRLALLLRHPYPPL
jgi:carbohydrate diacid regulator